MWKLYSSETEGIAIKTNVGSLLDSFGTNYNWLPGRVKYIDYDEVTLPPTGKRWLQFLQKRKSFEHEHEVRIVIQEFPDNYPFNQTPIYDAGNYYKVNLSILIHEVVIAPFAPQWLVELVQSIVTRYDLEVPVTQSTLAASPEWDSWRTH